MFIWESFVLGAVGALASAVVGAMAAGLLNLANVDLPLSVQLLLMSDTFHLSDVPNALAGVIAAIALVSGARALALRLRA